MPEQYGYETAQSSILIGDSVHSVISRFLDSNGDGSGTKDMSTTADIYFIKPPTGEIYIIDEYTIILTDDDVLSPLTFGSIAALANGCLFRITEQPSTSPAITKRDLLDGLTIKTNTDFNIIGTIDRWSDTIGSSIVTKCNLRTKGTPIVLHGDRGEALEFETDDDLTTISLMYVHILGRSTI